MLKLARLASLFFLGLAPSALAAFGVTTGSGYLQVDTGNALVYQGTSRMVYRMVALAHSSGTSSVYYQRRHHVSPI